jgi:S1-C subfamily serine protease
MKIATLGITVTLGQNTGAEITDEATNGAAALAGLHPGDVINAVDGKPVKTPMELAAELSNRSAGDKVRIGYLLHGCVADGDGCPVGTLGCWAARCTQSRMLVWFLLLHFS